MKLIQTASKDQYMNETQVKTFAALYTEEDFDIGKDGALKVTKGMFINTLVIKTYLHLDCQ